MLKWVIDISQFDIYYRPQIAIKGQALADFIVEFTYSYTIEVLGTTNDAEVAKEVEMERNKTIAKTSDESNLQGK